MLLLEDLVELVFAHDLLFQHELAQRLARLARFLDQLGHAVVAQLRIEHRGQAGAVLEVPGADLAVGLDAANALFVQEGAGPAQVSDRPDQVPSDQRHVGVQLELARHAGGGDRRIAARAPAGRPC